MTRAAYLAEVAAICRGWERFYDRELRDAKVPLVRVLFEQAWEASSDLADVYEKEAARLAFIEARR